MALKDSKSCISVIPKQDKPDEGGKNKSRTLWGTTTTTRGSCWELHTAHVLSVHLSTALSAQPSTLSAERKLYGSGNRDQELPASDLHLIFHWL